MQMPSPSLPKVNSALPAGAWLVVFLLSLVGFLNYLDRTMITTMRGSIVEAMHITDAQFGLLTSVFLWVYGLLSPFTGFLADRFSRSRVISISLCVWSITTFLTAYATNFEELLATRVLMGISESCYIPAAYALIVDYHKGRTRSSASGFHIAGIMLGQSFGFLGGWLAEKYDWTLAFIIFGVIGIVYSFFLLFLLKDAPKDLEEVTKNKSTDINFKAAIKDLLKRKLFILLLAFWSLLGIVGWMITGWLPTFYLEHFNLSQSLAGLYATGYLYPASIVGVILGGYLTDYWGRTYRYAQLVAPIIGLLIAVPCVIFASGTSSLPLAISLFVVYGLTRMFCDSNIMPILCLISDPRYRATGFGILNLLGCLVGGLGIYASGVLLDAQINLSLIFQCGSLLMILCALCLYLILRSLSRGVGAFKA